MNIWDRISRAGQPKHEPIRRDPLSIGVWVAFQAGAMAIAPWAAYAIGSLVLAAVGIGLSLLADAIFQPPGPAPQQRQATVRQSLGARIRFYGRVKVGGTVAFFETKSGDLYQLTTMNWGKISSIVERWLGDKQVSIDGGGLVTNSKFKSDGRSRVRLLYKDGDGNQTAHSRIVDNFSMIDENFRLRGMANCLAIFEEVKREDIAKVYPQMNPMVRHVIDASLCDRVRQNDNAWSDNPSDVIFDYMTGRDDAGYPWGLGLSKTQINLPSFHSFADTSDEAVDTKLGGTIKRYRVWGGFAMNEQAKTVIARFCRNCDGDIYMDTDGKIAIRGGKWEQPTLAINDYDGHIISAEFQHGNGSLAAFNELSISYTEQGLDFQETECDPWIDDDNIDLRGSVLTDKLTLTETPHHAQARRLGKIFTHRRNPEWTGTIVTNFHGFNAIGENMARIRFALLGIDTDFSINSLRILDNFTGVELSVSSLTADAYEWDAITEEGEPPAGAPDTSSEPDLTAPTNINVSAASRTVGGSTGTFIVATWLLPDRDALGHEAQYRSSPGGTWVDMLVSDGASLAESGIVSTGATYDVRIRTVSPGGLQGDWSANYSVVATPNTTQAAIVTGIGVSSTPGRALVAWVMSPSAWSIGARVYRNTISDPLTATLIATVYGSPTTDAQYGDEIAAGTYYYWVASWTGSFVEGTREPTGAIVVI